jgi:hypothetical protein
LAYFWIFILKPLTPRFDGGLKITQDAILDARINDNRVVDIHLVSASPHQPRVEVELKASTGNLMRSMYRDG